MNQDRAQTNHEYGLWCVRDEDSTETYCDTRRTPGCKTMPLKYRSKRKPSVEPQMTKQQTRLSPVLTN